MDPGGPSLVGVMILAAFVGRTECTDPMGLEWGVGFAVSYEHVGCCGTGVLISEPFKQGLVDTVRKCVR